MPFGGALDLPAVPWPAVLTAFALLPALAWWRERRGRRSATPVSLSPRSSAPDDPLPF